MTDGPPDRLGCFDQLKAFFASLGALFAGGFLLFGPQEVRDEIPAEYLHPLAIGLVAFGVLFGITAIFASGRSGSAQAVASRLKGLLFAGLFGVALWFSVTRLAPKIDSARRLAAHGVPTLAQVERYGMRALPKGGGTRPSTDVSYLDDNTATFPGHLGTKGGKIPILYDPDDPTIAVPGQEGDTAFSLLDHDPGHGTVAALAGLALVSVFVVLFGLKRFLFGKRPE